RTRREPPRYTPRLTTCAGSPSAGPMDVSPLGPIRAASFQWRLRSGAWAQTVIAKLTFELRPLTSVLAEVQEPVIFDDEYWDDDASRSVQVPADLAPVKTRADVVLVGNAYAPRGEPVRSLVTRLQVGELDKSIEVHADRAWTLDAQLRE